MFIHNTSVYIQIYIYTLKMTKDGILRNHLSLITKPNSPMNQSALRNTLSDSATFSFKYGTSDAPTSSQKTKRAPMAQVETTTLRNGSLSPPRLRKRQSKFRDDSQWRSIMWSKRQKDNALWTGNDSKFPILSFVHNATIGHIKNGNTFAPNENPKFSPASFERKPRLTMKQNKPMVNFPRWNGITP